MDSIQENLNTAYNLIQSGNYIEALKLLEWSLTLESDHIPTQHLLGQCKLALGFFEEAANIYHNLLTINDTNLLPIKAEAELVLGKYPDALQDFETYLENQTPSGKMLFSASIAAYKSGVIIKTHLFQREALKIGFKWIDNIPIDHIAGYVFQPFEFNDFEQIYLDISEEFEEENLKMKNRWFSINIPIYEFFTASEKQKEKAKVIVKLLSDSSFDFILEKGKAELELIINDLAKSETDARFGLEAAKLFNKNNFDELAKIVLALFLEHINQYGEIFGLDQDYIKSSNLQDLILLLPFKIAVLLMFLYAVSNPIEQIQPTEKNKKVDENLLAGLIALCFLIFYQELKNFENIKS